jgi:two-component system osmolarity sensor histidine kinase EnvZ
VATLPPSVRVEVEPGPEAWVRAPSEALTRAFGNILGNAARYAGVVRVSVRVDADWVVVCVDDDGPGIAPADRDRAFERFARLDEARDRDSGGAGLGLAIVRETVRAAGGEVDLGTAPIGGLRVEIRLPAAPSGLEPFPPGIG